MYDTYERMNCNDRLDELNAIKITDSVTNGDSIAHFNNNEAIMAAINKLTSFKNALMITLRILTSNSFNKKQQCFRNVTTDSTEAVNPSYEHRLNQLWSFIGPQIEGSSSTCIVDISWCRTHGDILAVAYAIKYSSSKLEMDLHWCGCVCIWSIKNPINPERFYKFPNAECTTIEFSPFTANLLAVGLNDGTVYVYDVSNLEHPQVAVSARKGSRCHGAVASIKWIPPQTAHTRYANLESILALYRNGQVIQYTIFNSPYLWSQLLMVCHRSEGILEGLNLEGSNGQRRLENFTLSSQELTGLMLCLDVIDPNIYNILTDEGTLYRCSLNRPHQYEQLLQMHHAAINFMDFSPWSPFLFLTCGNDW